MIGNYFKETLYLRCYLAGFKEILLKVGPLFLGFLQTLSDPLLSKKGNCIRLTARSYFFLSPFHWLIRSPGTLNLDTCSPVGCCRCFFLLIDGIASGQAKDADVQLTLPPGDRLCTGSVAK